MRALRSFFIAPFVIVSFALVVSLSVVLLWIVARGWENKDCDLSFSAGLLGTILTGYHLFIYDLTLLLLASLPS